MASTTLPAIIDRFQAVLEAAPLSLTHSEQPFSFSLQPQQTLSDRYWVQDDGIRDSEPLSGNAEMRRDRLTIWLAGSTKLDRQADVEALAATLNTVERQIIADGLSNSYHATLAGRETQPLEGSEDVIIASLTMVVDYDYSTAA